ncbi:MAG: hypothetical protein VXZ38_07770, partial [Planctomycetota bacterium]|nr:hypothetical protein [Planctomycetota bacterium]
SSQDILIAGACAYSKPSRLHDRRDFGLEIFLSQRTKSDALRLPCPCLIVFQKKAFFGPY